MSDQLRFSPIRHSHCYKDSSTTHQQPYKSTFSHHSLHHKIQRPISIFPATIINNGGSSPHQHRDHPRVTPTFHYDCRLPHHLAMEHLKIALSSLH
ncbi:hypothetical protein AVEN_141762-1 [Araneus ventricosus]|uniref:Uncharacterized protein n=1 Tax=Araneus ventricosus TaxID=182803 RepID=A0A4Y2NMB8_ARAVE|nr:hypothetical protein AVEN_141762-1 [Araneus ventricosus]